MKFPVFAVRDALLGFGMPILRDNDAVAARAFEFDCNRESSPYSAHPEHFSLYYIGEYDTDTGGLIPDVPRLVVNAVDYIVKDVKE